MSAAIIPGSHADLKAVCGNGDQAPFLAWSQRNRELVEQVACGDVECCGEWQRPGYYGWCSLLGCPDWAEPAVEGVVTERKNGCPKRFEHTAGSQLSAQDQASFGAACGEPAVALTEGE